MDWQIAYEFKNEYNLTNINALELSKLADNIMVYLIIKKWFINKKKICY